MDNEVHANGKSEVAQLLRALEKMQLSIAENIRRIEHETRRAERERIANQSKSEFISNLSHELRTPMHAILGFARQAMKRPSVAGDEKIVTMLSNIQLSGERLLKLINILLDLSKLEAGKIDMTFKKDDIRKAIDRTLREAESLIQSKNIRIVFNGGASRLVAHDHHTMVQVFMNLISNAIKFSDEGTEIHITLSDTTHPNKALMLLCQVADSGPGIPEDEIDSIFDKFFQSSRTKSGAGGTGLGLAITRQIVETHNGKIWAQNVAPRGACFNVMLPYEQPANA